jgi:hypothetical protein
VAKSTRGMIAIMTTSKNWGKKKKQNKKTALSMCKMQESMV